MASSEAENVTEATSASTTDAKAKREARKARILSSGTDRLARITKTGRGGEADVLYSDPLKSTIGGNVMTSTTNSTAASSSSSSTKMFSSEDAILSQDDDELLKRAQVAMQGGVLPNSEDDPGEIDISQQNTAAAASARKNPFLSGSTMQMGGGQQEGMPQDLQGMMAMMQKAMLGAGGGAGPGPIGPDGTPQQVPPFNFPFGSGAETQTAPSPQSSSTNLLDVLFNLLRITVFAVFGIALVYGALGGRAIATSSVAEDESNSLTEKFEHMSILDRWARLAYERPAHWEARYFGVESFGLPIHGIPVFWLFITLEIALQSSRIMLQRSRPSPPGFIVKASAYIPNAHIRLLIRTFASYIPLVDAFVNDLAIVVFTIGCTILFAAWKTGFDPTLVDGIHAGLQQVQSVGSGIGQKLMEMNDPVMASIPPVQAPM